MIVALSGLAGLKMLDLSVRGGRGCAVPYVFGNVVRVR